MHSSWVSPSYSGGPGSLGSGDPGGTFRGDGQIQLDGQRWVADHAAGVGEGPRRDALRQRGEIGGFLQGRGQDEFGVGGLPSSRARAELTPR